MSKFAVGDVVELTGREWNDNRGYTVRGQTVVVLGFEPAYLSEGHTETAAYFKDANGYRWYLDEGEDEPWAAKAVSAE